MTFPFEKGRYGVRLASSDLDVVRCQELRQRCFTGGSGRDADKFDLHCRHIMVSDGQELVATCRAMVMLDARKIHTSYAAQRYDLHGLSCISNPVMEVGRFCIAPEVVDADILRLVWGSLTRLVTDNSVQFLFGCASFSGADPVLHQDALDLLARRYQSAGPLSVGRSASEHVPLVDRGATQIQGLAAMPPLIRSYLNMGAWVSDHAVIDRDLDTLHVFCGVEVNRIPANRARALRALAM